MMIDVEETIVAIASPTSPAPRGIVRLSGDATVQVLTQSGVNCADVDKPHRFASPIDVGPPLGTIDTDIMLWPSGRSYTGQPSAELHTIGSLPVLAALVQRLISAGARAARPGEFTMRAFLAGRLDLTQAEAVLGVIEAEHRGSLNYALRQLSGNLSQPLEQMRGDLLNLLADVEAGLDFVDEDIEFVSDEELIRRLQVIGDQIEQTLQRMRLRGGGAVRPTVVLRGDPNAGKSCLINRLAGDQVAIVADVAGTTRDTVSAETEIGGQRVTLVDTAGLDDTESKIDRMAQQQAQQAGQTAAVEIWCIDCSRTDFHQAVIQTKKAAAKKRSPGTIPLWAATKVDLDPNPTDQAADDWIYCSAVTGFGIEKLKRAITDVLNQRDAEEIGTVVGTAARCSQSLILARDAVVAAIKLTRSQSGHELVAAELRSAAQAIGEVTGAVYTDDILDRVFGRFCIGK